MRIIISVPAGGWQLSSIAKYLLGVGGVLALTLFILSDRAAQLFPDVISIVRNLFLLILFGSALFAALRHARTQRRNAFKQQILDAMQVHDFARAIEIAGSQPERVAKDFHIRHNLAVCRALGGDREKAICELQQLRRDRPGFPLAGLVLGQLLLDTGHPQEALEVAEEMKIELPYDRGRHLLAARCLQQLRRLDDAFEALEASDGRLRTVVSDLEPVAGAVIAASIAIDRGDLARARELLECAAQVAPDDCELRIVQAELAVADESITEARAAFERATTSAKTTPLAFFDSRLVRLRERLEQRERQSTARDVVITAADASDNTADSTGNPSILE